MTEDGPTNDFDAGRVNVGRSALRQLNATTAQLEQSAVQRLTAEAVVASGSALGIVNASTVEIAESATGVVIGDYVRVEEARVGILLAPRVNGNVTAFLTLQSAFAFGAGYFVARSLAKLVFGRSKR